MISLTTMRRGDAVEISSKKVRRALSLNLWLASIRKVGKVPAPVSFSHVLGEGKEGGG